MRIYDSNKIRDATEEEELEITNNTDLQSLYEDHVVMLIRERYTINEELAILRQKDTKVAEYNEYNSYCEECKNIAKKLYNREV